MATAIRMPQLGMIMTEGTLAKWHKSPGSTVKQGESLAEITTEKISYELEAPESGVFHPVVNEGDVVPIEELIAHILKEGEPVPEAPAPKSVDAIATAAPTTTMRRARTQASGDVRAAPSARKLAAKLGIDIALVPPARPGGRIVETDVKAYAEGQASAPSPKKGEKPVLPSGLPTPSRIVPLAGIRKAIATNMRRSVSNAAQLSFHLDVDMTQVTALRREHSRGSDVPLSASDIIMKACAEALLKNPQLNTVLSDGKVYYFDQVDIGLAVALNEGLIVPVIKNVQAKTVTELASERKDISGRARDGKLKADEMTGGTFTLTVLGTVDGFTPLLIPGRSAILGVGRVAKKAVVVGDEIVAREMATLSLTVDHQVVDGAPASAFLRRLKQLIEHPEALFK